VLPTKVAWIINNMAVVILSVPQPCHHSFYNCRIAWRNVFVVNCVPDAAANVCSAGTSVVDQPRPPLTTRTFRMVTAAEEVAVIIPTLKVST
jgi:hypothetical protein